MVAQTDESSRVIGRLSPDIQQIGMVPDVVESIAEKTILAAMNFIVPLPA